MFEEVEEDFCCKYDLPKISLSVSNIMSLAECLIIKPDGQDVFEFSSIVTNCPFIINFELSFSF